MAPEILMIGEEVRAKLIDIQQCDVWSVGVTLHQLATGQLPFGLSDKSRSEDKILKLVRSNRDQILSIKEHPVL